MSSPIPVRRFLNAAQRRFRNARRGSVLILVVALLVLMALIGTAALTTNTIDRYATQQNAVNTEIDLLVEGVKNMAKSVIAGDVRDMAATPPTYRPLPQIARTYDDWDMPLMIDANSPVPGQPNSLYPEMDPEVFRTLQQANDAWLAPRFPDIWAPQALANGPYPVTGFSGTGTLAVVWPAIGSPLEFPNGVAPQGGRLFDTPGVYNNTGTLQTNQPLAYNNRVTDRSYVDAAAAAGAGAYPLIPGAVTITLATGGTRIYPAWTLGNFKYIAADADGDGIADAGLRKLPIGEINGVTYYYATRIIDNNSAINVNTAFTRDYEVLGDGRFWQTQRNFGAAPQTLPLVTNFFPSNVGLAEMLRTWDPRVTPSGTLEQLSTLANYPTGKLEFTYLNNYRFNNDTATPQALRPVGIQQFSAGQTFPWGDPDPTTGAIPQRNDFQYISFGDMLYMGLSRRMGNPGIVSAALGVSKQFRSFAASDAVSLAYHFVMKNPDASDTELENRLAISLAPGQNGKAYDPTQVNKWFTDNFFFDAELGGDTLTGNPLSENPKAYRSRRSMFTTYNPVSNLVTMPSINPPPSLQKPTKASLNTAPFDELMNAYYSAMSEGNLDSNGRPGTPYDLAFPTPAHVYDMYAYAGSRFENSVPGAGRQEETLFPSTMNDTNPQRVFRNSIRDNDITRSGFAQHANTGTTANVSSDAAQLTPAAMLRVRAALAAANTITMRDPTSDGAFPVQLEEGVKLNGRHDATNTPNTQVHLWVYGVKPQPFISEVYAQTDTVDQALVDDGTGNQVPIGPNPHPYIAIELFFPYRINPGSASVPGRWNMHGWSLALVDRVRVGPDKALGPVTYLHIDSPTGRQSFDCRDVTAGGDGAYFIENQTTTPELGTYVLLENYKEDGTGTASYRPPSSLLPPTGPIPPRLVGQPPLQKIYVADLWKVVTQTGVPGTGGELVLMAPVRQLAINAAPPPPESDPPGAAGTFQRPDKPIDSFDFTGLNDDSGALTGHVWHYTRVNKRATADDFPVVGQQWGFIYPGRYDGGYAQRRQQGTQAADWTLDPAANPPPTDPFDFPGPSPRPTLGANGGAVADDNGCPASSYPNRQYMQLLNIDQPGANPLLNNFGTPPMKYPFGAFARVSDVLQVPFIGSYRIKPLPAGSAFSPVNYEMNAISIDSTFAEDCDEKDDESTYLRIGGYPRFYANGYEQVGRFCPIVNRNTLDIDPTLHPIDDLSPVPTRLYGYGTDPADQTKPEWRYHWVHRVFDYVTVQDPQEDYLPNVKPDAYALAGLPRPTPVSNEGGTPGVTDPAAVTTGPGATALYAENGSPTQGLININTASWRVLSAMQLAQPFAHGDARRDQWSLAFNSVAENNAGEWVLTSGPNGVDDNIDIAKLIVFFRDGITDPASGKHPGQHGPYRSLFDIYRLMGLEQYYISYIDNPSNDEIDDFDGDFSPFNGQTGAVPNPPKVDGRRNDYEERLLLVNRLGNLITTRSDSFTVYIVVQGWRNAGSTDPSKPPEKVVERRAAFIADRSAIGPNGGQLKVINVPTE